MSVTQFLDEARLVASLTGYRQLCRIHRRRQRLAVSSFLEEEHVGGRPSIATVPRGPLSLSRSLPNGVRRRRSPGGRSHLDARVVNVEVDGRDDGAECCENDQRYHATGEPRKTLLDGGRGMDESSEWRSVAGPPHRLS